MTETPSISAAFVDFFEMLEASTVGLTIDELNADNIRLYHQSPEVARRKKAGFIRMKQRRLGFDFGEDDFWIFLVNTSCRWSRVAREGKGTLMGGFTVRPLGQFSAERPRVSDEVNQFWGRSALLFNDTPEWAEHLDDPGELRWFTATTPPRHPVGSWTYGCVKPRQGTQPTSFHFYDSGKVYELPFRSPAEYFSAMLGSGAVEGWQLFFVEPDVLIEKNRGVPYYTWHLHRRSELNERIAHSPFDRDQPYDRLDLMLEYMERCVALLPVSFPTLDFTVHRERWAQLRDEVTR